VADVELAIVGAGPAGSAAARSARLAGVSTVALIDRATFPRDKACGDGLGPGVVRVMADLGLGDALESYAPIKTLAVSSPSRVTVSGPLPLVGGKVPVGYVIPRQKFDDILFRAALGSGAVDFSGHDFDTATYSSSTNEWTLTLTTKSDEQKTVTAKYLIGADGPRSKVRRLLGQPFNDDAHTGTAVRIYARTGGSFGKDLRLDFMRQLLPAYGWVFPIDEHTANIGVGIDVSRYQERRRHLNALLESYESQLKDVVSDPITRLAFILPYGSQLPRLAFPTQQAALIGDAGSMVNPLTGEGIYYGMWAGMEVGKRIALALQRSAPSELSFYEARFRSKFSEHYQTNQIMKNRVAQAAWCDLVISACARDKRILGELIDLMMGDRKRVSLGLLGKIALGGIL
jgi:menaquinone-9 beta-reductase